jgi:hypothetical protein
LSVLDVGTGITPEKDDALDDWLCELRAGPGGVVNVDVWKIVTGAVLPCPVGVITSIELTTTTLVGGAVGTSTVGGGGVDAWGCDGDGVVKTTWSYEESQPQRDFHLESDTTYLSRFHS